MMPFEELVDLWFEEGLENIDEDKVLGSWLGNFGQVSPTIRYHEILKYLDPVYRLEEWCDETWMRDVKKNSLHCIELYSYICFLCVLSMLLMLHYWYLKNKNMYSIFKNYAALHFFT